MISKPTDLADEQAQSSAAIARCPVCGHPTDGDFLRAPDRFHWRREAYRLLRCTDCEFVWQANPPLPEQMGIHYSTDYHRAIRKGGETAPRSRWRRHNALIKRYKSGGTILDIGCSSGAFLGTMRSKEWKLYGIEMERSTAEEARGATGADIFVGETMEAPFAPCSFDVITSFDVLEHVYDPRAFLARVFDWLKPGGIYFTMVPNISSWEARAFGSYWYGLELPRHISHFSPRSLRQIARSLGFQELHLKTPPISYIEPSVNYLWMAGAERLGIKPTPMSQQKPARFLERLVRKGSRETVIRGLAGVASLVNKAASIEAVFERAPIRH